MSTTELATRQDAAIIEQVVMHGDLKELSPAQRVVYYRRVCESLDLNPLTRPFDYLVLNNKLTLYARKEATDQIRAKQKVSIQIMSREKIDDVYVVTARATMPDGRTDESTGAVNVGSLRGEVLANAYMKSETKAKRRVTLSICGLGWLDESEVESISDAKRVTVAETGEIVEPQHARPAAQSVQPPAPKPANGNDFHRSEFANATELLTWAHDVFNVSSIEMLAALPGVKKASDIVNFGAAAGIFRNVFKPMIEPKGLFEEAK